MAAAVFACAGGKHQHALCTSIIAAEGSIDQAGTATSQIVFAANFPVKDPEPGLTAKCRKIEGKSNGVCSRRTAARRNALPRSGICGLGSAEVLRDHAGLAVGKEGGRRTGVRIVATPGLQHWEFNGSTHDAPILTARRHPANSTNRFSRAASVTTAQNCKKLPPPQRG
jgi:hypothetical protein